MGFRTKRNRLWYLIDAYAAARQHVIANGFLAEIVWQQSRDIEEATETEFLSQFSWVVLAAGFRDSVVSRKYPEVLRAFLNFSSAREISRHAVTVALTA